MANLYDLLGVSKTASKDEIKKAYHKMARSLHPDVNPDKKAAEKFKTVSAAYELLSDPDKRRRYDAGEIDEHGNPTPFGAGAYDRGGAGAYGGTGGAYGGGRTYQTHNMNPEDFATMFGGSGFNFSDLFGFGGGGGARRRANPFGGGFGGQGFGAGAPQDTSYALSIPFDLAVTGGETTISLQTGKRLKIKIPAGIETDETLRLKGQGSPDATGRAGDALIKITVEKSAVYTRDGMNLTYTCPVSLKEAVLGAKVQVPTPSGPVAVTIPPFTSSGKKLRLKGKGVAGKGDMFIQVEIQLPSSDRELARFAENWDTPKPKR